MLTIPAARSRRRSTTSGAMISRFKRCCALRWEYAVSKSSDVLNLSADFQGIWNPKTNVCAPCVQCVISHLWGDVFRRRFFAWKSQRIQHQVLIAPGAHGNGPVCLLLVATTSRNGPSGIECSRFLGVIFFVRKSFDSKALFESILNYFTGIVGLVSVMLRHHRLHRREPSRQMRRHLPRSGCR